MLDNPRNRGERLLPGVTGESIWLLEQFPDLSNGVPSHDRFNQTLLKNEHTAKVGVKRNGLSAALDEDNLTNVLLGA